MINRQLDDTLEDRQLDNTLEDRTQMLHVWNICLQFT